MSARERLGAAIHTWTGGWTNTTFEQAAEIAKEQADAIFRNDPALEAALELGLAWQETEAALPEGLVLHMLGPVSAAGITTYTASADRFVLDPAPDYGGHYESIKVAIGPTPAAALQALTAQLREAR